jgi:hypothetical protein
MIWKLLTVAEKRFRTFRGYWLPEKDIGIQKIKKTSFGLEVSVI